GGILARTGDSSSVGRSYSRAIRGRFVLHDYLLMHSLHPSLPLVKSCGTKGLRSWCPLSVDNGMCIALRAAKDGAAARSHRVMSRSDERCASHRARDAQRSVRALGAATGDTRASY